MNHLNFIRMDNDFPFIAHQNFSLRQIISSDIGNVYKGLSHPDVIKYYGVSYNSLSATEEQMRWFKEIEQNKTGIWWAIVNLDDTLFYGAVGLNNLSHFHKKAELGYWLLPEYWGQKIMANAIPLVCEYAFKKLKIHRIEAMVETENKASKGLLAKLDFNFEGTLVDCEIKNGAYISLESYAKFH